MLSSRDCERKPLGYRFRSSKLFILSCVTLALFSENFIYSFIVPILPIILEDRLHLDKTNTQVNTSAILSIHAFVCFLSGPIIGNWADKSQSRKGPLLLSLSGEIVGTVIVAAAPSLQILFIGRIIQAFAGNAAWIVGFATVADTVGAENRSRTISTISAFFMSGLLLGPIVSGTLVELTGYWPTWLTAIAILLFDMFMRLIMIENSPRPTKNTQESRGDLNPYDETSPLLSESSSSCKQDGTLQQNFDATSAKSSHQNFYKVLLTNPHALAAMACHGINALTLVSFDTTLPLYVSRAFGWDTMQTSLMFMLLQMPSLFLSPFTGWMKDRVGTKVPCGVGFFLSAALLWTLGTSGPDGFSFIGSGSRGQTVYMISMLGLGIARTLITGCGVIEMTNVVTEIQDRQPGIFGPNGGFSRAYSLTNMSWTFSMFIGPLLTGFLTETMGYYYMNLCLAVICSVGAILALIHFDMK